MIDLRTADDEMIDDLLQLASRNEAVEREASRRAEIRIDRDAIGEKHDAAWYESRQTEDQWLSEIGAEADVHNDPSGYRDGN